MEPQVAELDSPDLAPSPHRSSEPSTHLIQVPSSRPPYSCSGHGNRRYGSCLMLMRSYPCLSDCRSLPDLLSHIRIGQQTEALALVQAQRHTLHRGLNDAEYAAYGKIYINETKIISIENYQLLVASNGPNPRLKSDST